MMTVHKLSAADGYTYLTRQVASADERRLVGQSLADYYAARGNPAGVWVGSCAEALGLAGTQVSEAQMRALFGEGCHPDRDALVAAGTSDAATRLGRSVRQRESLAPIAERIACRVEDFEREHGRPPSSSEKDRITAEEGARRQRQPVAGFDL